MKNKRKGFFLQSLLIFQLILIILICAALVYVNNLLELYEENQPERLVEAAVADMAKQAENRTLWEKYDLPEFTHWEAEESLQKKFARLLTDDDTKISKKIGLTTGDVVIYQVKTADNFTLAEVTLKPVGDPVTKLAIFTWQEWELCTSTVSLAPATYTMTLPQGFSASINGMPLSNIDGTMDPGGGYTYTVKDLLFLPEVEILSESNETANYTIKDNRIIPAIFDYDLTLPATLTLTLDGQPWEGESTADGHRRYKLMRLTKPAVTITDIYGNTVEYEGESEIPLTYLTVTTTDRHTLTVSGMSVPDTVAVFSDNPDFAPFAAYVENLPRMASYSIAVLENNVPVVITSPDGTTTTWDGTGHSWDMTASARAETVPDAIAAEVNVLEIAELWSLFVSNDLLGDNHGLAQVAQYLIPSSQQYEVAYAYATGIDITFTSLHTLMDPPFTEEKVTNFVQITDTCFSVDVSFHKHMLINYWEEVVDSMNERLYFVKYDDPNNEWDTATWKLACMKEIVNAE